MPIRLASLALLALLLAACSAPSPPARLAAPDSLASPADTGSGEPHLVTAPDGAVWLSWLEREGSGHVLQAARLEGERWGAPIVIARGDSFMVNWADFPTLLPLAGGRLAAHWPWKSGLDVYAYDVRVGQSADGGTTWSAPITPHRDATPTEHGFVSLVADPDGVRAIWLDGRDYAPKPGAKPAPSHEDHGAAGEMALRTAVIGPDGVLSGEAVINPRTCDCCQTAAVETPRGVLVAYRDRSADEIRDISVARLANGHWSEPAPLHRDGWKITGCPVNGPALDARGDRVAAAWFTSAQDTDRVLLAFSDDGGGTFGAPVRVDAGAPLGRVDARCLADGSALVLWLESEGKGPGARICLRHVGRDGSLGSAVTVAMTPSARSSGFPRMALAGDRVVLAWTDPGKPARVRTTRMPLP